MKSSCWVSICGVGALIAGFEFGGCSAGGISPQNYGDSAAMSGGTGVTTGRGTGAGTGVITGRGTGAGSSGVSPPSRPGTVSSGPGPFTPGNSGGGICDPGCQALFFGWCVAISAYECVQCYSDADCAANLPALGPTCDTATNGCKCSSDADCKNSLWGHICDTNNGFCACVSDSDCGSGTWGTRCEPQEEGSAIRSCVCTSDADCSGSDLGAKCAPRDDFSRCSCGSTSDCTSSRSCTGSFGLGTWTYCQ